MAKLQVYDGATPTCITDQSAVKDYLAKINIGFERWPTHADLGSGTSSDDILAAYDSEVALLSKQNGYTTADVINIEATMPNLDAMLAKFDKEHWHDEDEVRFILDGLGIFHINPPDRPVVAVTVTAGDLLVVPKGTKHWFHLGSERRVCAIRLFQDTRGWAPHYTPTDTAVSYP
ncbi:cupin domain-containing protein, partial [Leptolyngbya cf. ectocarpi LEGE 11479]